MRRVLHGTRRAERSVRRCSCTSSTLRPCAPCASEPALVRSRTPRAAFSTGPVAKGAPCAKGPHRRRCGPLAYLRYASRLGASRMRTRAFVCGFIGRCCRILGVRLPRPRVAPALAAGKAPLFGRRRAGFGVLTAKNRTCRRPFQQIDGRRTRFLRQHRRHPRRAVS